MPEKSHQDWPRRLQTPQEVLQAARDGRGDLLKEALVGRPSNRVFLDLQTRYQLTCLMMKGGHSQVLLELIEQGYDIPVSWLEDLVSQLHTMMAMVSIETMLLTFQLRQEESKLVRLMEQFVKDDNLLTMAKEIVFHIASLPATEHVRTRLGNVRSLAAERQTAKPAEMADFLRVLDSYLQTGTSSQSNGNPG
ncbi:hypothetical protein ACOMHN_066977 [Nucella lapillus]